MLVDRAGPAGEHDRGRAEFLHDGRADQPRALVEHRPVWFEGRAHDCPVWDREGLPERAELHGPAIVEEFGATTVVPPGWRGAMDSQGNLRFEREPRA